MEPRDAADIPSRISWSLELLRSSKPRRLLELGPGAGLACRPFLHLHGSSEYVGMDRSSVAKQRFLKRNSDLIEAGRAHFQCEDFLEAESGIDADLILAINVNVFWTRPSDAFQAAKRLFSSTAGLLLVYEAPSAGKCSEIAAQFDDLRHHPFELGSVVAGDNECLIACWFH